MKGLLPLPWSTAEMWERYLICGRFPLRGMEPKPQTVSPDQSTRARKRLPHSIRLWKASGWVSICQEKEEFIGDTVTFLKGQPAKFRSQAHTLGSSGGGWCRLESPASLGFVAEGGHPRRSLSPVFLKYPSSHLSLVVRSPPSNKNEGEITPSQEFISSPTPRS